MFGNNQGGKVQALTPASGPSATPPAVPAAETRPDDAPYWADQGETITLARPIDVGRDGAITRQTEVTINPVKFSTYIDLGDIDNALATGIDDDGQPTGFAIQSDRRVLMQYITRLTGLNPIALDQMTPGDIAKIQTSVRRRVGAFAGGNSESGTAPTS